MKKLEILARRLPRKENIPESNRKYQAVSHWIYAPALFSGTLSRSEVVNIHIERRNLNDYHLVMVVRKNTNNIKIKFVFLLTINMKYKNINLIFRKKNGRPKAAIS